MEDKDNKKVFFTLSNESLEIIAQRATSPNRRGEWISKAIVDYDKILSGVSDSDTDSGLLEQVVKRLNHIEKQLSVIITKNMCVDP